MLLLILTTLCASAASPKRLLLSFEAYHTVAGLLRTELASQMAEPIDFSEVSLESTRFTDFQQAMSWSARHDLREYSGKTHAFA